MTLAFAVALALAHHCAPGIAPEAILSIVSVESGFDPLAINVNRVGRLHAATRAQAETIAARWIAAGYSVDLGIAQINSGNLAWTGLAIASAFDACANLAAAQKLLEASFAQASRTAVGIDAISRTFSLYNSGNVATGFRNQYVARVWRAAKDVVPQLAGEPGATLAAVETSADAPPSFVVPAASGSVLVFK